MRGEVRELVPPERLMFSNVALDDADNPILEGLTTVTFAEEAGKTRLVVQSRAMAVVEYAVAHIKGMEAGWTQSIERLESLLGGGT
jgi:uncharacterized protein YndB with AHSA1/START domain